MGLQRVYIQPQINPILIAKEHSKGPPPQRTNKHTYKNDPLSLKKLRIIIINKAFLHVKKNKAFMDHDIYLGEMTH